MPTIISRRCQSIWLGVHSSIAGGTPLAVERAAELACTVTQIFVKNNNRWVGKPISDDEAKDFRTACARHRLKACVAHACYLINLASPDRVVWRKSIKATLDELARCQKLGLSHLVVHPGAHVGSGETKAIQRVAASLDALRTQSGQSDVRIALETTAGQGTGLGFRFEHLRDIMAGCRDPSWIDICLDTCHVFAAGYDLRTEEAYHGSLEEFDKVVGLARLKVIHLNDSRRPLGSRVDRHENIGEGKIGLEGFRLIMNDSRLKRIPKILETPKGEGGENDRRNLELLRGLVGQTGAREKARRR